MVCVKVELLRQNRKAGATLSAMNKITQDMRFKQAVIIDKPTPYYYYLFVKCC